MMRLLLCLILQPEARQGLRLWTFVGLLSGACVYVLPVQAKASLSSMILPQAVTRSVTIEKSTWQGMDIELEHLSSDVAPEATLEQLAMLIPELTPVWSEAEVVRAHWMTSEVSYSLFLWATERQGTEGLLSAIKLTQPKGQIKKTSLPASFNALDWLPKQASPLFRFTDASNGLPAALSSFAVPMLSWQLIDHLKSYGERNGWVLLKGELSVIRDAKRPPEDLARVRDVKRLHEDLSFMRDAKRLSFLVSANDGNTIVLVFETSRDAP
jgi:hypothetical protein